MQDELGSPLRVSNFMAGEGTQKERNGWLNYGYDEFGNDLGKELEETGIPNPYDGQGEEQPFGYTGYRYDEVGGTYFAQAREYQVGNGRFTAEDVIRGNGVIPGTRELFTKYVSETIDPDIFDDGLGLKVKLRPVPNSKPVPLEEIEELFEKDVDGMAEDMLLNFENRNIMLTIQQLDALILIRFNTGYLGSDLTKLVEDGASREEWDKVITSQSRDRKIKAKEIYWGNIFSYKKKDEENCAE